MGGSGGSGKAAEAEAYADGRVDHMVKACSATGKKTHKDRHADFKRAKLAELEKEGSQLSDEDKAAEAEA